MATPCTAAVSLNTSTPHRPLRLWPGVVVAVLLVLFKLVSPLFADGPPLAFLGGLVGGLLISLWWLLFSRARWFERLGAVALSAVALFVTSRFLHTSLADARVLFAILAIPALGLAFVAWAVASQRLADRFRRLSMVATILIASGAWTLVRVDGISGSGVTDFHWRWTPSPEERILARQPSEAPLAPTSAPPVEKPHEKAPEATATDAKSAPPRGGSTTGNAGRVARFSRIRP